MPDTLVTTIDYMPVGDISVLALCFLILILFLGTFVDRNEQYRKFWLIIGCIFFGTMSGLAYHQMLGSTDSVNPVLITIIRDVSYILYQATLLIYVKYILMLVSIEGRERRKLHILTAAAFLIFLAVQILGNIFHFGFYIDKSGTVHNGGSIFFAITYAFFVGIIFYMLFRYRNRMIPQIATGILLTFILCIILLAIQGRHHQTSFTSTVFLLPAIGFMYLLHSNPFDLATGAVSGDSLSFAVRDCYKNHEKFILMYLDVVEMNAQQSIPQQMRFDIYRFYRGVVRKPILFHMGANRLILMFKEKDNKNPWMSVEKVVEMFAPMYDSYRLDFKAIFMESVDSISRDNDYREFFQFISIRMSFNDYYYVTEEDIEEYEKQKKILEGLEDIADKLDLNDERVLVYCQPVYNVDSRRYDTAEALMRLELPEFGIVPPYLFIPLAEKHNLIHELSLIILNKTCAMIRQFLDENLPLKSISVNFSIQEIRDENFCKDVIDVISRHDIPYEKIAIEITESRNERDFDMVKDKIEELKTYGIKFYLDDFGTGYSNFERIMELPFDIIKFDRSMVIESGKNKASEYMVDTFASMFRKLQYKVLYEGIEDDNDEKRCISMSAQYLQGFKYSKPIEIENLRGFLTDDNKSA